MFTRIYRVFYQKFYSLGCGFASPLLGRLAAIAFISLKYAGILLYKLSGKKETIQMSYEEARALLNARRPDGRNVPTGKLNPLRCDLSVIIPVYMAEKHIIGCLDSILKQKTKYNIEVIAINDGSTDRSLELLSNYGDPRLSYFTIPNGGVGNARNVGTQKSSGRYLTFVDADDKLMPGSIDKLLDAAFSENAAAVEGNYIYNKNGKIENGNPWSRSKKVYTKNDKHLVWEVHGFPWAKIFKRELFENYLYPTTHWEDSLIFAITTRLADKYVIIPDMVYEYLIHDSIETGSIKKGAIKNIDSYYVVNLLIELNWKLGLPFDDVFYKQILHQFGDIMHSRIFRIGEDVVDAALVCARHTLEQQEYYAPSNLNYQEKNIRRAILTLDKGLYRKCLI